MPDGGGRVSGLSGQTTDMLVLPIAVWRAIE